jgi:hypothetical protein
MKRIFLLTSLLLASVSFGCQGMGPGAGPGSGSSFQGGTEAGNPPTDGGYQGGTEAGNPPTGEHPGSTTGGENPANHELVGHCGDEGVTISEEDGKPCSGIDINSINLPPPNSNVWGILQEHDKDQDSQQKPVSLDPEVMDALSQHMGLGAAQPLNPEKENPVIKMPSGETRERLRFPFPPDPEN